MVKENTLDNYVPKLVAILAGLLTLGVAAILALTVAQPVVQSLVSFVGLDTQQGFWYITRAAGLAAYLLLWLSTLWGLAVASKNFDPLLHRAFTFDVHEFLSLLAIGFIVVHVGVLLVDQYLPFSLAEILVPFIAPYRAFWVGIGVIGMYLTLLVTLTFYLRTKIGYKAFRAIHLFSFLGYIGVTVHSIFSGTDSALLSTKLVYIATALVIAVLTAHWWKIRNAKGSEAGTAKKSVNAARPVKTINAPSRMSRTNSLHTTVAPARVSQNVGTPRGGLGANGTASRTAPVRRFDSKPAPQKLAK